MTTTQNIIVGMALFLLLAFLLSFWISPNQEQQGLLPYLTDAFQQCVTQKTESFVRSLSNTGGYSTPLPGIAHEITFEKAIEAGMSDILLTCENLLQQEGAFTREIKKLRVSVADGVTVFFDGFWKSATGKIIPGFVVHLSLPVTETFAQGREILSMIKETEQIRNIVLSALDGGDPRQAISYGVKQITAATLSVLPQEISLDKRKKEISFPLRMTVVRDNYVLSFFYPVFFNALDLQEGCRREILRDNLPEGEEITFDCGWYQCIRPWTSPASFPCKNPIIFIDNQLASDDAG